MTTPLIAEALASVHRFEDAANELCHGIAFEIRDAVSDFNSPPLSHSTIDELRERLLRLADTLAPPRRDNGIIPEYGGGFSGGFSIRIGPAGVHRISPSTDAT